MNDTYGNIVTRHDDTFIIIHFCLLIASVDVNAQCNERETQHERKGWK